MPDDINEVLKNVKGNLSSLKKKGSKDVSVSMDNLSRSINELMELFKEAATEIKVEEEAERGILQKLEPLLHKVDEIEEQNKKIAQGMLAIADMLKEIKEKIEKTQKEIPLPRQAPSHVFAQPMPPPMPEHFRQMPPSPAFRPEPPRDIPPMPHPQMRVVGPPLAPPMPAVSLEGSSAEKKKKLLGIFK